MRSRDSLELSVRLTLQFVASSLGLRNSVEEFNVHSQWTRVGPKRVKGSIAGAAHVDKLKIVFRSWNRNEHLTFRMGPAVD